MTTTLGADVLTSTTNTGRDPWQEQLGRLTTVPATKVLQAAEIIRGFAGSWAATYLFDPGVNNTDAAADPRSPTPQQLKTSRLGQPGFPEISFAPFNARTNRFASKGGSLLGHPISFSVVGPTAKNSGVTWQWTVTDNSAVPGTGDQLTLQNAGAYTIDQLYAANAIYLGGLYVVISLTGSAGQIYDAAGVAQVGGVGDGLPSVVAGGETGLIPKDSTSKYEIFRVRSYAGTQIELEPNKRLATYFTIPATPIVRAITLITPTATRLVAVPTGATKRQEQLFAVVPPVRTANLDEQYSYATWNTAPHWHEIYPATPVLLTGSAFEYKYKPVSPLPTPKGYYHGRVWGEGVGEAVTQLPAGRMYIAQRDADAGQTTPNVGDVVHVYGVRVKGGVNLRSVGGVMEQPSAFLGWFEVVAVAGSLLTVRRYEENDPLTGVSRIRAAEALQLNPTAWVAGERIELDINVHDPITALWQSLYADVTKIDAARLTNLINPEWVAQSAKQATLLPGISAARADKAVFDTSYSSDLTTAANPGSLLDLGFRVVFYPAKEGKFETPTGLINAVVPDWDYPVCGNEILLDPSKPAEKQYVEVDYANGLVRFSHPIKAGSPLYPTDPDVFGNVTNPRGELVLFACCVPYSMEEGQLGAGVRATGGLCPIACAQAESSDYADVYGERIMYPLANQVITSGHTPGTNITVTLPGIGTLLTSLVPQQGHVELLWGTKGEGGPLFSYDVNSRGSVFGYDHLGTASIHNAYGGGVAGDTATVDDDHPAVAVWRREVTVPNDLHGIIGTDYQYDITYGSAKRATTIRLDDAEARPNLDGTVTFKPRYTRVTALEDLNQDLFSSWLLSGGEITSSTAPVMGNCTVSYNGGWIMYRGVRREFAAGTQTLAQGDIYYLYAHCSSKEDGTPACAFIGYDDQLPLNTNFVLLAKVDTTSLVLAPTWLDLRYPLQDMDLRDDIMVGGPPPKTTDTPFFATLREAVNYANELMTPEAGDIGRNLRIRVKDHTLEDCSAGPIVIKTDGLIIEGAPRYDNTASPTVFPEIKWSDGGAVAENTALFDLNGHSGLVFRDLAFRTPVTVQANAVGNFVFTNTQDSSDVTIDNCKVINYVAGFLSVTAGTQLRWTVTRNKATNLRLYGLLISSQLSYSTIADNVITGDLGVTSNLSNNVKLRGNLAASITLDATKSMVDANWLTGDLTVNYLENKIIGNHCDRIMLGASADYTTVQGNRIATRLLCEAEYCTIQGNISSGDIDMAAGNNTIVGNYTATHIITQAGASSCTIGDNRVSGGITIGEDGTACNSNHVTGNISLIAAAEVTVTGNIVGGYIYADLNSNYCTFSANRVDGKIELRGSAYSVSGNNVTGNIELYGVTNAVTGNWVASSITVALACLQTVITGNWVLIDIAVTTDAALNPAGLVLVGNHVNGSITRSTANTPKSVVVGNHATNIWGVAAPAASVNNDNSSL